MPSSSSATSPASQGNRARPQHVSETYRITSLPPPRPRGRGLVLGWMPSGPDARCTSARASDNKTLPK